MVGLRWTYGSRNCILASGKWVYLIQILNSKIIPFLFNSQILQVVVQDEEFLLTPLNREEFDKLLNSPNSESAKFSQEVVETRVQNNQKIMNPQKQNPSISASSFSRTSKIPPARAKSRWICRELTWCSKISCISAPTSWAKTIWSQNISAPAPRTSGNNYFVLFWKHWC